MNLEKTNKFSWVLADLIIDLGAVSNFYNECNKSEGFDPFKNKYHLGKIRMCHTNAVVGLSKLNEALVGYAHELKACCSKELVSKTWQYTQIIQDKKIYEFRSKYAAHVFDKKTGAPLDLQSGYERLTNIVGSTAEEVQSFYNWINIDILDHLIEIQDNLSTHLESLRNHEIRT